MPCKIAKLQEHFVKYFTRFCAYFRIEFDRALDISTTYLRQNTQANQVLTGQAQNYKKLSTMTPLQTLCSFQTWNARPISEALHERYLLLGSFLKKHYHFHTRY